MLEKIIDLDKELLVFLNGLGSSSFDGLWLMITKPVYWTPFFLLIFSFVQKKLGWKNFGYYLLFTALLVLFCDQSANLFKWYFERSRPCNDEEIKTIKIELEKISINCHWTSGIWDQIGVPWNEIQNTPRDIKRLQDLLVRTYSSANR